MNNMLTPKRKQVKKIVISSLAAIVTISVLLLVIAYFIAQWFDQNRLFFKAPVQFSIHFQAPVEVQKRVYLSPLASPSAIKKEVFYIDPNGVYEFDQEAVKKYVRQENNKVFGDKYWDSLDFILTHEANYRVVAQNRESTAFGMFQFLDSTWKGYNCRKTVKLQGQVQCGLAYIKSRYGNPDNAKDFWAEHHWY